MDITTDNESFIFPLSYAQQRMWFLHQFEGENNYIFNIPILLSIKGAFDLGHVKKAVGHIIKRHEILRTNFKEINSEQFQVIWDRVDYKIDLENINEEKLDAAISNELKYRFNLEKEPLFKIKIYRIKDNDYVVLFLIHHIIFDGWSQAILTKEFAQLYNSYCNNTPIKLDDISIQYVDYTQWQMDELKGEKYDLLTDYWKQKLEGSPQLITMPDDNPDNKRAGFKGGVEFFKIGSSKTKKIQQLCINEKVSIQNFLLSAYAIILSKYSNQDDIVIGSPFANRTIKEIEELIGLFVNTLPLRVNLTEGLDFKGLIHQVSKTNIEALDHSELPFDKIVELLNVSRDISKTPVFQVFFAYQNTPVEDFVQKGLEIKGLKTGHISTQFELSLLISETGQELEVKLEYNKNRFNNTTIQLFIQHFNNIIEWVLENSNQKIRDIEFLTQQELNLIHELNNNHLPLPGKSLTGLFEEQALKTPQDIALVWRGKKLKYHELNSRANQLATELITNGAERDYPIGILIERSFDMVIAILAVIKANAAYIPIDTKLPSKRINTIIQESGIKLLVTDSAITLKEGPKIINTKNIDITQNSKANLNQKPIPGSLLYIIYTSGTTGVPKGIKLTHKNVVNLLFHQYKKTNINFNSVLQFASIGFDVASQEIFSTLCYGGKLVLIDDEVRFDYHKLYDIIRIENVKSLFLPAAYIKTLSEDSELLDALPTNVEHIISAGEQLFLNENLKKNLKKGNFIIHNHYGPAETHVVTTNSIAKDSFIESIPSIGKPVINTQVYILNKQYVQQPFNVVGEIYISGSQLGYGYWKDKKLTDEKFLKNKLNQSDILYKTGDLGKMLPNGDIKYIGRADNQVKIRGNRVELDEITYFVNSYMAVREGVVIYNSEQQKLICYYQQNTSFDLSAFKEYLFTSLPSYMIPEYYVQLEELPKTINGKIDKSKLELPEFSNQKTIVLPKNETEKMILKIWSEVLEINEKNISVNDSFFDIGGHSLKAMRVVNRLNNLNEINISLNNLFEYQNITELASYINILKRSSVSKNLPQDPGVNKLVI